MARMETGKETRDMACIETIISLVKNSRTTMSSITNVCEILNRVIIILDRDEGKLFDHFDGKLVSVDEISGTHIMA